MKVNQNGNACFFLGSGIGPPFSYHGAPITFVDWGKSALQTAPVVFELRTKLAHYTSFDPFGDPDGSHDHYIFVKTCNLEMAWWVLVKTWVCTKTNLPASTNILLKRTMVSTATTEPHTKWHSQEHPKSGALHPTMDTMEQVKGSVNIVVDNQKLCEKSVLGEWNCRRESQDSKSEKAGSEFFCDV